MKNKAGSTSMAEADDKVVLVKLYRGAAITLFVMQEIRLEQTYSVLLSGNSFGEAALENSGVRSCCMWHPCV